MNLYRKSREVATKHPLTTGIAMAGFGFMLLNGNKELFLSLLPNLLLFLPCLLMMAVCMRSGMGQKCVQQTAPAAKPSGVTNSEQVGEK